MPVSDTHRSAWGEHFSKWHECRRCTLSQGRAFTVLYRGFIPCDVLFVGEAPGESENALGEPFVGPSGDKLNEIISEALNQSGPLVVDESSHFAMRRMHHRQGIYIRWCITNVIACIPWNDNRSGIRAPSREEIEACEPRLTSFIRLQRPRLKLVVALGQVANKELRGHPDIPKLIDIVHPSAILRGSTEGKRDREILLTKKSILTLRREFTQLLKDKESKL